MKNIDQSHSTRFDLQLARWSKIPPDPGILASARTWRSVSVCRDARSRDLFERSGVWCGGKSRTNRGSSNAEEGSAAPLLRDMLGANEEAEAFVRHLLSRGLFSYTHTKLDPIMRRGIHCPTISAKSTARAMTASRKTTALRRVGAWCARAFARVAKHTSSEKKSTIATTSPETKHESWMPSENLGVSDSSADLCVSAARGVFDSDSSARADRGTNVTSSSNYHVTATNARTQMQHTHAIVPRKTRTERQHSEVVLEEQLSLVATQRLRVAGLYAHAQQLKRKNRQQRVLSYEKSMQQPLHHIQVRRRSRLERAGDGELSVAVSPKFVCIRKAKLGHEARQRLRIVGLNANDSVPPWIPLHSDRWSCELALSSPRLAPIRDRPQHLPVPLETLLSPCDPMLGTSR